MIAISDPGLANPLTEKIKNCYAKKNKGNFKHLNWVTVFDDMLARSFFEAQESLWTRRMHVYVLPGESNGLFFVHQLRHGSVCFSIDRIHVVDFIIHLEIVLIMLWL